MPFSQSYAFMTQMSSVWPIDTSVTDFSAVYNRAQVVWFGGWYFSTLIPACQANCAVRAPQQTGFCDKMMKLAPNSLVQ